MNTTQIIAIPALRQAAAEILAVAYARARSEIAKHRGSVERIADRLLQTRYLDGHEIAKLISGNSPQRNVLSVLPKGPDGPAETEQSAESQGRLGPPTITSYTRPPRALLGSRLASVNANPSGVWE